MTRILDTIEQQLVDGIRARARRRRWPRVAAITGVSLVAVAGTTAGIAAVAGSPTDEILRGSGPNGQRPGTTRIDLHLKDPGGLRWGLTVYVPRRGEISTITGPDGLRPDVPPTPPGPPSADEYGAAGFQAAASVDQDGPVTGIQPQSARYRGRDHYFLAGTVAGNVRSLTVTLGTENRPALLAEKTITLPIAGHLRKPGGSGLTDEGMRLLRRLPKTIDLRPFVVTFTPDRFRRTKTLRFTYDMRLDDGRRVVERSGPQCFSHRCVRTAPRVP